MAGLSYEFGRTIGDMFRKGKWLWRSVSGDEKLTVRGEYEVGRGLARKFAEDLDPDPRVNRLVVEVGNRLVSRLLNKKRRFSFRVLSTSEANAFALPGGFVFVTRALLDLCDGGRDEVAFILGHEMGHVVREHAINRIMDKAAIDVATRVLSRGGWMRKILQEGGRRLLESAYSQDLEFEADDFGYRLAESAGFDKRAAFRMLRRLQNNKDLLGDSALSVYFSSHPPIGLRIDRLNRRLRR
ncbi:MAG: M48 family metallopeptidase [Planctomycetota bacterium]|jgi:predicted Zn-dependent protease